CLGNDLVPLTVGGSIGQGLLDVHEQVVARGVSACTREGSRLTNRHRVVLLLVLCVLRLVIVLVVENVLLAVRVIHRVTNVKAGDIELVALLVKDFHFLLLLAASTLGDCDYCMLVCALVHERDLINGQVVDLGSSSLLCHLIQPHYKSLMVCKGLETTRTVCVTPSSLVALNLVCSDKSPQTGSSQSSCLTAGLQTRLVVLEGPLMSGCRSLTTSLGSCQCVTGALERPDSFLALEPSA